MYQKLRVKAVIQETNCIQICVLFFGELEMLSIIAKLKNAN